MTHFCIIIDMEAVEGRLMGEINSCGHSEQFYQMSSRIKAAVRVRPFLKSQIKHGYTNNLVRTGRGTVEVGDSQQRRVFSFDHVFDHHSTQQQVYEQCGIDTMVSKCLQGYHSTIFAYGQTGSGKTFTMHGHEEESTNGIIPKAFSSLFGQIRQQKNRTHTVSLSFLQIYSEKIYDLLNPVSGAAQKQKGGAPPGLRLRWSKDEQFTVENLFVFECRDEHDLMKHFSAGLKNRINASHRLNLQSSRSHSILTVRIDSFDHINGGGSLSSRLELVDLAGSERIGMTGTEGRQAKQSIDINKSLFTLRQVISILSQGSRGKEKAYVPYRDSKLTSILKQSIGGNSYCLMLACLNPNDAFLDENMSTLTYATKASYITNEPTVNDDPQTKIVNELKKQVKGLTEELGKANKHIEMITSMQRVPTSSHQQLPYAPASETVLPSSPLSPHRRPSHESRGPAQPNSQRLVESINMVRQLLKSNKELREKLEMANTRNDQKDIQIFELTKQNEAFKERNQQAPPPMPEEWMGDPFAQPVPVNNIRSSSVHVKRRASTRAQPRPKHPQPQHQHTQQPSFVMQGASNHPRGINSHGQMLGIGSKASQSNFNYWNSVEINQYYMNERGIDAVPTNFSRRQGSTSHEKRQNANRNPSLHERRNALTAKLGQRKHLQNQGSKFFSYYQHPQEQL